MATAKKCDRCGKYYEKNKNELSDNRMPIIRVDAVRNSAIKRNDFVNEKTYDLCDDCVKAFFEFMNVGGSEND